MTALIFVPYFMLVLIAHREEFTTVNKNYILSLSPNICPLNVVCVITV